MEELPLVAAGAATVLAGLFVEQRFFARGRTRREAAASLPALARASARE